MSNIYFLGRCRFEEARFDNVVVVVITALVAVNVNAGVFNIVSVVDVVSGVSGVVIVVVVVDIFDFVYAVLKSLSSLLFLLSLVKFLFNPCFSCCY